MIDIESYGTFKDIEKFLKKATNIQLESILIKYAKMGVDALYDATPKKSGLTANSWSYTIHKGKNESVIEWHNTNINKGVNIAIILNYGHGTGTGGYVQGRNYISPTIQPIFEEIANAAWEEIVKE